MRLIGFYLKILFAIAGFSCLIVSYQMTFQRTCKITYNDDYLPVFIPGSASFIWDLFLVGSLLIFLAGFFFNHLASKIIVYVFAGILIPLIGFISWIAQAGWGQPCGYSYESGYDVALIGSLLVLTATIISMHRPKRKKSDSATNVLDQ